MPMRDIVHHDVSQASLLTSALVSPASSAFNVRQPFTARLKPLPCRSVATIRRNPADHFAIQSGRTGTIEHDLTLATSRRPVTFKALNTPAKATTAVPVLVVVHHRNIEGFDNRSSTIKHAGAAISRS